jgi:hypothetical protein
MAQIKVKDGWDLFFRDLIYYQQSNLDDTEFIERLNALLSVSSSGGSSSGGVQNPDLVDFIPLLDVDVTGKAYSTIQKCSEYLSTLPAPASSVREKVVRITTTRNSTGTTNYSRLCNNGTLYNYVNYVGSGKHCKVIFDYAAGDSLTPGNISRYVRFKDMTVVFGAGITAHDRELALFTFDNCDLLFYRNVLFPNVTVDNCNIITAPGVEVSFEDSLVISPRSNSDLVFDELTKQIGIGDPNLADTIPVDPTL